jgi:GNAT superfamily N-acetyltransferase
VGGNAWSSSLAKAAMEPNMGRTPIPSLPLLPSVQILFVSCLCASATLALCTARLETAIVNILYEHLRPITEAAFVDLLKRSTLAERRPINDPVCVAAMLKHANLVCTAWDDSKLVGVARSLTDFEYCCYLSDLAVDEEYQRIGIGKGLIRLTQSRLGKKAKIILLAAPKAEEYYRRIGFEAHSSAWLLDAKRELA